MVKRPKYPAQNLTEEDKEILDQAVFKYAVKFYALIQQYPSPKKYAEKRILKSIQSDKDIAELHIVTYLRNSASGYIFKPGEINQRLANDIRNSIQNNYRDMTVTELQDDEHSKRFFNPRYLRENVLKELERYGIILHLEGKHEIKSHQLEKPHPGKRSSSKEVNNDHGGKPSAYIVTEEVEKLKKAMNKPQAIDFLYNKIIRSRLAHKLAKYNFSAFLYAAKMSDESGIHRMMKAGASFFQNTTTQQDSASFKTMFLQLQRIDDNQLEQIADDLAKSAIEDPGYNALLFMGGLLKM
jgi:hypothetical protein